MAVVRSVSRRADLGFAQEPSNPTPFLCSLRAFCADGTIDFVRRLFYRAPFTQACGGKMLIAGRERQTGAHLTREFPPYRLPEEVVDLVGCPVKIFAYRLVQKGPRSLGTLVDRLHGLPLEDRFFGKLRLEERERRHGFLTAPTIHAGFDGHIRLEMVNHGKVPIRLRVGMRICQLIFEQTLGTPDKGYKGQFSGQGAA